jgi:histidinol-phosphate/aromatic aminotransferase/cobyric acid decarboxylase-like protein
MISPRDEVLRSGLGEHGGRLAIEVAGGAQTGVAHDFSVCLNAFGPADVVRRAVEESRLEEYPDPRSHTARCAASKRWGRPIEEIALGAGAAELIYAACCAYLRPGNTVLVATPAFGDYARAAQLNGAVVATIAAGESDLDDLAASVMQMRPRLVFAATPMNPTGATFAIDGVARLADACRRSDSLLVLDQAYDAFTAHPLGTPALPGHTNVLHLRSLTKDHALAGVRVAFGVGPAPVIDAVERVRVPWAASTAAQAAAIAALTEEALAHVARTTHTLRSEAVRIDTALRAQGIETCHRGTHYLLVRCTDAGTARRQLLANAAILVRDCTSFSLPEWIRVAARLPWENDALIGALTSLHVSNSLTI